jgi:hypothetical protein
MVAKVPVALMGPVIVAPAGATSGGQLVAQVPLHALVSGVSVVNT